MTESHTYIGLLPCGCLKMAAVDNPDHAKVVAKMVAQAIRAGLTVSRMPKDIAVEMVKDRAKLQAYFTELFLGRDDPRLEELRQHLTSPVSMG